MKHPSKIFTILVLCLFANASHAETQTLTKADKAIKAVKELCLTGTQYDLKADAKGNLKFITLRPGAEGSVSVNVRESSGAAAIFDEKLRNEADQNIRYCIKPYIHQIIDAILEDTSSQTGAIRADLFIDIIKTQQVANVRKSYGEFAGQNFSDRNLDSFIQQRKAKVIANDLINNKDYINVVLAIKYMNPISRNDLYSKGYQTYRPTWAELGRIDPKGQTIAGQEADKMIAHAIIEKTQQLLLLPDDEIKKPLK